MNQPDIPNEPAALSKEQDVILKALGIEPDLIRRIQKRNAGAKEETDWLGITKRSLAAHQAAIMGQQHHAASGVKTKSVSHKSVGNKAILSQIAEMKADMNTALSSLHSRINQLEATLDTERRQRFLIWIMMLYLLETNQVQLPKSSTVVGWFLSRQDDPHFMAMANNLTDIVLHDVLANINDVHVSKKSNESRFMPNSGQFKKFTSGFPVEPNKG